MAAMFKLKGKIAGWSGLWLCAHHSLHQCAFSSAKFRIYVPPPSSRSRREGTLPLLMPCLPCAACGTQLGPTHGRRDAAACPPPATTPSHGCPCLHRLQRLQ